MMIDEVKDFEEKMKRQISGYENMLSSIRAGRANPAMLDKIQADYYGTPTPLSQMAEIKIPDARTIVINPWDATSIKNIERAINASDLGLNPMNDGKIIRLNLPAVTEEKRKDLTKQVAKMGEDAKVYLRNIRRDANEKFKDMKKKSEMTEDDLKKAEKDIQDMLDKFIKEVDAVAAKKSKEIMEL
ncbi:MAG: ribosome recycling factor [Oscillospiraceae bacterium]|nr:ribosome recycling factor [Oscillospiraceae bacterium]